MIVFAMAYDDEVAITLQRTGVKNFAFKYGPYRASLGALNVDSIIYDIRLVVLISFPAEFIQNFARYRGIQFSLALGLGNP